MENINKMKNVGLREPIKFYVFSANNLLQVLFIIIIFYLPGCTVAPSENNVKDSILKYFSAKKYKVIEINIGDIKPIPISKYTYMGTKGYIVDIKTITLEPTEDIGVPLSYKKGEQVTFKNGSVTIKENVNKKGEWIIADITGISVI